jgi:hypothetical protein
MKPKRQDPLARRNRANKNRGREFENRCAEKLGWTRVPYSGAQAHWGKGDVVDRFYEKDGEWHAECKTTIGQKTGLSINGKWIKQMQNHAASRRPILFFTRKASATTWVLVPLMSWFHFIGIKNIETRPYLSESLKKTEKGTFLIPQALLDAVASGVITGHIQAHPISGGDFDTYYLTTLDKFKEGITRDS